MSGESFVFAYGSNLDTSQMQRRCPNARAVGRAVLPRHRLTFAGWSWTWGGGTATIVRAKGHAVPGVVYRVPTDDLKLLDRFEGYPHVYDRTYVRVKLNGRRTWVQTYVLVKRPECKPGWDYLKRIFSGYLDWKFRATAVRALVRIALELPDGMPPARERARSSSILAETEHFDSITRSSPWIPKSSRSKSNGQTIIDWSEPEDGEELDFT